MTERVRDFLLSYYLLIVIEKYISGDYKHLMGFGIIGKETFTFGVRCSSNISDILTNC